MSVRRSKFVVYLLIALAAAGCRMAAQDPAGATAAAAPSLAQDPAPTLYGRWRIVAVNGSAPLSFGGPESRQPTLEFSPGRYGGSTGCNSFGGTGLLVGNRWFGEPPMATQQGCGHLTAQEDAIMGIASGGPAVAFPPPGAGAGEAVLTSRSGSLRLRREAAGDPDAYRPAFMLLAGTAWEVRAIDGQPLPGAGGRTPRLLTFEADRWTLDAGCRPLAGRWRQAGPAVTMEISTPRAPNCAGPQRAADDALRAMIAAAPRYAVGPNRELVMGGGDHWLVGQLDRSLGSRDPAILRGQWRIDSVDGAAPARSERPASLGFGSASYAVWDGCNHSEGVSLVLARQLFTRGSGMSTLAACAPDPVRQRIHRIVAGNPRIARTDSGGLALVAEAGTLRLSRLSQRPFGTGEQLGLRGARTIVLINPSARLTLLPANRFRIVLDCGHIEGDWRGGQPARFSPDALERTAPACDSGPRSPAFRLGQFFTGNIHAVTGPNRDIVLLVNESQSLAGRVAE